MKNLVSFSAAFMPPIRNLTHHTSKKRLLAILHVLTRFCALDDARTCTAPVGAWEDERCRRVPGPAVVREKRS